MDDKINHIWNEFYEKLYQYINSKVKDKDNSEDILQNVFIKIYNNIDNLEDKSKIKPWIYSITKNTIIDFYKSKEVILLESSELDNYLSEDDT